MVHSPEGNETQIVMPGNTQLQKKNITVQQMSASYVRALTTTSELLQFSDPHYRGGNTGGASSAGVPIAPSYQDCRPLAIVQVVTPRGGMGVADLAMRLATKASDAAKSYGVLFRCVDASGKALTTLYSPGQTGSAEPVQVTATDETQLAGEWTDFKQKKKKYITSSPYPVSCGNEFPVLMRKDKLKYALGATFGSPAMYDSLGEEIATMTAEDGTQLHFVDGVNKFMTLSSQYLDRAEQICLKGPVLYHHSTGHAQHVETLSSKSSAVVQGDAGHAKHVETLSSKSSAVVQGDAIYVPDSGQANFADPANAIVAFVQKSRKEAAPTVLKFCELFNANYRALQPVLRTAMAGPNDHAFANVSGPNWWLENNEKATTKQFEAYHIREATDVFEDRIQRLPEGQRDEERKKGITPHDTDMATRSVECCVHGHKPNMMGMFLRESNNCGRMSLDTRFAFGSLAYGYIGARLSPGTTLSKLGEMIQKMGGSVATLRHLTLPDVDANGLTVSTKEELFQALKGRGTIYVGPKVLVKNSEDAPVARMKDYRRTEAPRTHHDREDDAVFSTKSAAFRREDGSIRLPTTRPGHDPEDDIVFSKEGVWLLASATLLAEHDATTQMPSLDALVKAMPTFGGAAEEDLSCTAPQRELVEKLIPAYNSAPSAQARFKLVGRFMVEAAAVEGLGPQRVGGKDYLVTRYDMHVGADPTKAFFAEDYPWGDVAHAKTLALGVLRWCVGKLLELKSQKFASAAERDAALNAAKRQEIRIVFYRPTEGFDQIIAFLPDDAIQYKEMLNSEYTPDGRSEDQVTYCVMGLCCFRKIKDKKGIYANIGPPPKSPSSVIKSSEDRQDTKLVESITTDTKGNLTFTPMVHPHGDGRHTLSFMAYSFDPKCGQRLTVGEKEIENQPFVSFAPQIQESEANVLIGTDYEGFLEDANTFSKIREKFEKAKEGKKLFTVFTGDATDHGPKNIATLERLLSKDEHGNNEYDVLIIGNRDGNKTRFRKEFFGEESRCTTTPGNSAEIAFTPGQWNTYEKVMAKACAGGDDQLFNDYKTVRYKK